MIILGCRRCIYCWPLKIHHIV